MSEVNYFTLDELAAESEKLLRHGQPLWAIAKNPKYPPDIAAKIIALEKAWGQKTKPAGHEQ